MTRPKIITPATVLAVSLVEVKEHVKEDTDASDTELTLFLNACIDHYQWRTGRTIHETVYEAALDCWPCGVCILPMAAPLISVDSVTYHDSDGVATVWDAAQYEVDTFSEPGCFAPKYGQSWPSFTGRRLNRIIVRYSAGIENTPSNPPAASIDKLAILHLVASNFANRESVAVLDRSNSIAFAENLITKILIQQRMVKDYVG